MLYNENITREGKVKMETVKEEIAKNLLYYRKKAGYTQKEFAKLLGVRNSAVSNWESGQVMRWRMAQKCYGSRGRKA